MDYLKIEYSDDKMNGCMCLDLSFFPCKINTAKKIFALAVQWCSDDTIIRFNNELSKMRDDLENKYTTDCNSFWKIRQIAVELDEMIGTGKEPNGVPISVIRMKSIKEQKKKQNSLKRDYKREIKEVKRLIELLDKNINILHERIKLKRRGLYESL